MTSKNRAWADLDALSSLAVQQQNAKQWAEASATYTDIFHKFPEEPVGILGLAKIAEACGLSAQARDLLERHVEKYRNVVRYHDMLCDLQEHLEDPEVTIDCLRRAAMFCPREPDILIRLGRKLMEHYYGAADRSGSLSLAAEAEGCFSQALELEPQRMEIYGEGFLAAWRQGQPGRACEYLSKRRHAQSQLAANHKGPSCRYILSSRGNQHAGVGIGHLGLIDYDIKSELLGWRLPNRTRMLAPHSHVANRHYLRYWEPYIEVVTDPDAIAAESPHLASLEDPIDGIGQTPSGWQPWWTAMSAVEHQWEAEGRGPLLTLTNEDRARGYAALSSIGMPRSAWFVTLHVRSGGFKNDSGASNNADIQTYFEAMRAVVASGGWVVRMGDDTMERLPAMPGVLDYAHSPVKADWMDVFLCAACRFFIGTASGLHLVPHSFGVPCVLTNFTPQMARPFSSRDLFIPKLHRFSDQRARVLKFEESWQPPLGGAFYHPIYKAQSVTLIDNAPEDIRQVVEEMIARLDGSWGELPGEVARQNLYDELAMRYGTFGLNSRVGGRFLQKYADLLGQLRMIN